VKFHSQRDSTANVNHHHLSEVTASRDSTMNKVCINDDSEHRRNITSDTKVIIKEKVIPTINQNATKIHNSKFREHFINGVSGLIAGACGTVVGHPLDTVKIQLQVGDLKQKAKINSFNILHLYRGFLPPLFTSGIAQFMIMSLYENIKTNYLHDLTMNNNITNLQSTFIAASISGGFTSFISTPIQLIKIQQQSSITPIGVRQCIHNIVSKCGWTGLFHGSIPVGFIEGVGRGVYMLCYEYFKNILSNDNPNDVTMNIRIVSAASAGSISWLVMYPMDSIKSRRLSDLNEKSSLQCFRYIWETGGIRAFYRGCFFAVVRSAPVAATILPLYEYIKGELS